MIYSLINPITQICYRTQYNDNRTTWPRIMASAVTHKVKSRTW